MEQIFEIITSTEAESAQAASQLAGRLAFGAIVLLNGGMGAGKSVFARGIVQALGYDGVVTSPTFTLMNEYPTVPPVYHFDLYRLEQPEQLYDIGYEEYVYGDGVALIEWSQNMEYLLPENYIEVRIEKLSPTSRRITVFADGLGTMLKEE